MTQLHNPLRSNTKAVIFDVGGVLIDLHAEGARRELIEKYGFVSQSFGRLTRSSFESHPRSITELAMIGCIGTSEYLDAFLHECGVSDTEASNHAVQRTADRRENFQMTTSTLKPVVQRISVAAC